MKRTREKEHKSTKMRKKENSPQRPRKRRKFAATLVAFVVSALIFANRICDIQSTSIPSAEAAEVAAQQTASQGAHQANELSAVAQPSSDNQASSSREREERLSSEPQDTSALVGQSTDLTCVLENAPLDKKSITWLRYGISITHGRHIQHPFDKRFSLPEISDQQLSGLTAPGSDQTTNTIKSLNYTLHIKRVLAADDGTDFVCLTPKSKSRSAKLTVLQPPTWLDVVAKIEEPPSSSADSASGSGHTLLAAVVPAAKSSSQPDGGGEHDEQQQQITRILVRQNTRLRLECRSGPAKPEPKLVWFDHQHRQLQDTFSVVQSNEVAVAARKNNDQDQPETTMRQSSGGGGGDTALVYSFTVQRQHNEQTFTCQAEHPAFEDAQRFPSLYGRQPRHRVRLEVQFEPEISLTKDRLHAIENQPIRFHCEARARPNLLTYRWYIDDRPVANATEPELQISQLSRQMNQREIRCQVSNEVGANSAVLRLSVSYEPAFVSHLLPVSLQPQIQLAPQSSRDWTSTSIRSNGQSTGRQDERERLAERARRHEIVLARQLAIGVEQNQDVELRCDFDGHPRVSSVQWFKLATEYSIMGNVTPEESEDLIRGGALYATFRHSPSSLQAGSDEDFDGAAEADETMRQIDYEKMSFEELADAEVKLAAAAAANGSATSMLAQLEPLISEAPPTPTNTVVFEPLDWTVSQEPPISSGDEHHHPQHQHHQMLPGAHRQHRSLAQQHQHQQTSRQSAEFVQQQQQQPITTLTLASRSFASAEIEASSVHSNRDRLNWRQAEVASSKLQLRQVNVDSVGKYVCMARLGAPAEQAAAGQPHRQQFAVARAIYLVLREKPRIISHPLQRAPAVQVGRRQTVSVECLAQINTILDNSTQIQWFKEGKLIEEETATADLLNEDNAKAGSRNISIIVERSPDLLFIRSKLIIRRPTQADFGVYNCTISNSNGVRDTMAINLQPTNTSAPLFRLIAAIGVLSILVLGCTILCLLAFAPQRRKLADKQHADSQAAKVKSALAGADSKLPTSDRLDSAATTTTASTSSTHGESDTDSLRKSQASASSLTATAADHHQQQMTLSEAPLDATNPSAHLYGATNGLHLLTQQQPQPPCHYMQLNEHHYLQQQQQQQQQQMDRQTIYQQTGWPSIDRHHHHQPTNSSGSNSSTIANGHYQMPSSMVALPVSQQQQQPPPLPPPPTTMIVESPYVSNGRTYYTSTTGNSTSGRMHYASAAAAVSPSQVMVTTDGEAQFESQYGSMISNAYRTLGYSTTSSPSSGGSSSSGVANAASVPAPAMITTTRHSSGSASSSPNSMTTYHNLQPGGNYMSAHSLQRNHSQQLQQQHPSPPSSDIISMKTSDNNNKHQTKLKSQPDTEHSYLTTAGSNNIGNNLNSSGLATHV